MSITHSMFVRLLPILTVALGWTAIRPVSLPGGEPLFADATEYGQSVHRNPRKLQAAQWLGESSAGIGNAGRSRVRFEWDQVTGVRAYVLRGRWTGRESWAVRAAEYRVTPRNATWWGTTRVAFDAVLSPGSHSWRIVAIHGPNDTVDFDNATWLAFDVAAR